MSTYTPLASTTLTEAASSVTLGNIPQTYTDLVLVVNQQAVSTANHGVSFNGDTNFNYSTTAIFGDGSSATSERKTTSASDGGRRAFVWTNNGGATAIGTSIIQVMNYSNTTTHKTVLSRGNNADNGVMASVGLWQNTAAITSLTYESAGNINSGSTFTLYGIAAGGPLAFSNVGSTITTDGTYWYHTFTSSGTFTPTQALTADILVVAGGGSGGSNLSGGGGAGGLTGFTGQSLINGTNYTVTVGAGAPSHESGDGSNGNDSRFGSLTLVRGGGGGGSINGAYVGKNGGSGGGAFSYSPPGTAGTGTAGQGNDGGTVTHSHNCGGGGGATAVGSNGTGGFHDSYGGAGGAGSSAYSSWGAATSTGQNIGGTRWYAGGGGGGGQAGRGAGGNGGGGAADAPAISGTANTGGGGGGSWEAPTPRTAGGGGSGIVIVRYPV